MLLEAIIIVRSESRTVSDARNVNKFLAELKKFLFCTLLPFSERSAYKHGDRTPEVVAGL